ncbi:hypothetical protein FB107DRAFT_210493 [Schizophyllum commune]
MPPKKRAGSPANPQTSRKKVKNSARKPVEPSKSPSPPPAIYQLSADARVKSRQHAEKALLKQYQLQTKQLTKDGFIERAGRDPIRQLIAHCTVVDSSHTPLLVFMPNLLEGDALEHINEDSRQAFLQKNSSDSFLAEKLVEIAEKEWAPEQPSTFDNLPNAMIVGETIKAAILEVDEPHALDVMDVTQKIMQDYPNTKELFFQDRCWLNSCIYYFKSGAIEVPLSPPVPPKAWRVLVVSGEFTGGELYSPQIMVKMSLKPGHVVAYRGDVEWRVSPSEGLRSLALHYTSAAVWDLCNVACL